MFTSKRFKSAVLLFTLFCGVSIFAQKTVSNDASNTKVKDAELQKFANVYQKVQKKNQEVQKQFMGAIKDEGLTVQRYTELRKAENNANSDVEATEAEKKKRDRLDAKINKIEPQLQKEQTAIIKKSGLTMNRYNEIGKALRSDKDLQKKFRGMLMKQKQ